MKKELFLHIGPPKTGTTTVQHFLAQNRDKLIQKNILYPFTEPSHWKLALNVGLTMWPWTVDGENTLSWSDVVRISEENPNKKLLLSSESFSYAVLSSKKDASEKLIKQLKSLDRELHVIIYLRRQDLWVESYFIEYLKHFGEGGLDKFVEDRKDSLDYYNVLSFWSDIVGIDHLHVRVYEPEHLLDIRADFMRILGVEDISQFRYDKDKNHRPHLLQLQILKGYVEAFHEKFPALHNDFNKPFGPIDKILGGFLFEASKWPSTQKFKIIPFEKAQEIMSACETSNAKVAKEFLGKPDGQLFSSKLSPYEHKNLEWPADLNDNQQKAIADLWGRTCRLMEGDDNTSQSVSYMDFKKMLEKNQDEGNHKNTNKYSVERYTPDLTAFQINYEHWHRYLYATNFSKDKAVLDIACGEGYGAYLFAKNAKEVVGVDIDENAIAEASQKYKKNNLTFRKGSVSSIPVEGKEKFDLIVSFETIEHVNEGDQVAFLSEVKRLLRPSGLFIVSTPNKKLYSDQPNYNNEFHEKEFYTEEFFSFLKNRFRYVDFLGQDIYTSSVIHSKLESSLFFEYNLELEGQFLPKSKGDFDDTYIVAICSEQEITEPPSSLLYNGKNKKAEYDLGYQVLYIDTGNGFSEDETIAQNIIGGKVSYEFELSNFSGVRALRFDPAPYPVYVELKSVVYEDENGRLIHLSFSGNSIEQDGKYFLFDTYDPQVLISIEPHIKIEKIFFNINYVAIREKVYPYLKEFAQRKVIFLEEQQMLLKAELENSKKESESARNELHTSNVLNKRLEGQLALQKRLTESAEDHSRSRKETIQLISKSLDNAEKALASKEEQLEQLTNSFVSISERFKTFEKLHEETTTNLKANIEKKEKKIAWQLKRLQELEGDVVKVEARYAKKMESVLTKFEHTNEENIARGKHIEHLNELFKKLENADYQRNSLIARMQSEIETHAKYTLALKNSLSFRLGWALTAPFRWLYETIRMSFWKEFLVIVFRYPKRVFQYFSFEKIRVLQRALKTEPPKTILANFKKLLQGGGAELVLTGSNSETVLKEKFIEVGTSSENELGESAEMIAEPINSKQVHFHVDRLLELDFHFSIQGWLFAEEEALASLSVEVKQGEQKIEHPLFYPFDRIDVFNHFGSSHALLCGFEDQVEKPFLGKVELALVAKFTDGSSQFIELGETNFNKPFVQLAEDSIKNNRKEYLKQRRENSSSSKAVALYTNSKGNYFFNEIKALIAKGITSNGWKVYDLDETDGFSNDAFLHIVVAPHEFFAIGRGESYTSKPSDRLILLNTEQPSSQWFRKGTDYFSYAIEIWDMNFYAYQRLRENIINTKFLALGHVPGFGLLGEVKRLPENDCTVFLPRRVKNRSYFHQDFEERPIDILFIGHASPRRQQFFAENAAFFSKYKCYFHLTDLSQGPVLQSGNTMNTKTAIGLAQRAKIILNIHHGTHEYFEWHRMVMHGIWQRGLVISDLCSQGPPFQPGKDFIHAPLNELAGKVAYFLDNENGKKEASLIIDHAHRTLTENCNLTTNLIKLIEPYQLSKKVNQPHGAN